MTNGALPFNFSSADYIAEATRARLGKKSIFNMSIEDTGNGNLLVVEGYSGRWFWSSIEAVKEALDSISERFKDGEYLALNDMYEALGIEKTHFGHQFGWPANEDWCDYTEGILYECSLIWDTELEREVLVIDIYTYPMECWMEV